MGNVMARVASICSNSNNLDSESTVSIDILHLPTSSNIRSEKLMMGNCCHKPTSCDSFSPHLKTANVMARRESMSNKMGNVMARRESMSNSSEDSDSSVAKTIRESMVHWSQLSEAACNNDGEAAEIDNKEVFKELQSHPQWGHFFATFGYDLGISPSHGLLEVGHKFAEGGQAELFHVHIKWISSEVNENDFREGREWVLKVFKKGTLLRQLQSQWPNGYLRYYAEYHDRMASGMPPPRMYCSRVAHGVLLKDGRFAFLIEKEQEDLRNLINRRRSNRTGDSMSLAKDEGERIMYRIAEGMDWLHRHNIVHRDLKAANVLHTRDERGRVCSVADYECSRGVVGTGFWRAPEILQALIDKKVREEVFTKEVDVYAYGMTCYEILTGKLPFEGHPWGDYDLILGRKQRPMLPEYVDDWMRDLISRCWEGDPTCRPSFQEVMDILAANSLEVREYQRFKQKWEKDEDWKWKERRVQNSRKRLLTLKSTFKSSSSVMTHSSRCDNIE